MRGFLLIHVERHAMLYGEAVAQFAGAIERASLFAKDKPEPLAAIDKVAEASAAWQREVGDPAMRAARDPATYEAAVAVARAPAASDLQQSFRAALDAALKKVEAAADKQDRAANHALRVIKASQLLGGSILAVAALIAGWWLYGVIAAPVTRIGEAMRKLAGGDRSVPVTDLDRKDETGRMAQAVQVFKDAAIAKARLEAEAGAASRNAEAARAAHGRNGPRRRASCSSRPMRSAKACSISRVAISPFVSIRPSRPRSTSCASISTARSRSCNIRSSPSPRTHAASVLAPTRSRAPQTICRAAQRSRRRASRRRQPRSTRSPPP
jgi:HAMP domain-containing protein